MKRIVSRGKRLEGVVYKTPNIIVQQLKKSEQSKKCVIIGNGNSLSVDDNDFITLHDPGMKLFSIPTYVEYTSYAFYFSFECEGLKEAAKEIANFINTLEENYDEIVLIGHSKCGICLSYAKRQIRCKTFLITISTPFEGTVVADKEYCEKTLKNPFLIWLYNKIFSNHNVDRDIIPYSELIKEVRGMKFKPDLNITSEIDSIWECCGKLDLVVFLFGKCINLQGDGIVATTSQEAYKGKRNVELRCSHATSLLKGMELYFCNECRQRG